MATFLQTVLLSGLTPTWNSNKYVFARLLQPAGNVTISLLSNSKRAGVLLFRQDATGNRTLTINTEDGTTNVNGASITVRTEPNSYTQVEFIHHYGGVIMFKTDLGGTSESLGTLSTPSLVVGTETDTTIPLSWGAITNATGYTVQRDTNNAFPGPTTVYAGSGTSFTDDELTESTTYYYRIQATAAGYTSSGYGTATGVTEVGIDFDSFTIGDSYTGSAGNLTGHTAEAGGTPTKVWSKTGNLVLLGDGAIRTDGADNTAAYGYPTSLTGANQVATARIKFTSIGSVLDLFSILLRCDFTTGGETGYEFRVFNTGTEVKLQMYYYTNGSVSALDDGGVVTTAFNDLSWHDLEVSVVGSTLTLKLDGATINTETDSNLTGGSSQRGVAMFGRTAVVGGVGKILVNHLTAA